MTLLLHLADFNERSWADRFAAALPGRRVVLRTDAYDPEEIEYIFIWKPKPAAFADTSAQMRGLRKACPSRT